MERGQLASDNRSTVVFIFEDLVAHCIRRNAERLAIRLMQWEIALNCWSFDYRVLDYIAQYTTRYDMPVEVVTWRPSGFAAVLHNRLWELECPVRETRSSTYDRVSPLFATNREIMAVYDANPDHRFGYGYKCRDFESAAL